MRKGYCKCGPFRVNMMPQGMLKPYLLFLLSKKSMHGLEMIEEISERSNGIWKSGPAAVYPSLKWLAKNGYIAPSNKRSRGVKTRHTYSITKKGFDAVKDYKSFETEWFQNLNGLKNLFN